MWLIDVLHKIPHRNFSFNAVSAAFNPEDPDYLQFLGLWACLPTLLLLVFLLAVILLWIIRCCCKRARQTPKKTLQTNYISGILIFLTLLCCAAIGVCLYSNELLTRGLLKLNDGLCNLVNDFGNTDGQLSTIEKIFDQDIGNTSRNFEVFAKSVFYNSANSDPEKERFRSALSEFQNASALIMDDCHTLQIVAGDFKSFNETLAKLTWAFSERWSVTLITYCVFLVVMLLGFSAFCRRSKVCSVLFSGAGVFVLIIDWLIVAIMFGGMLATSDLCAEPMQFFNKYIENNATRSAVDFYMNCQNDNSVVDLAQNVESRVSIYTAEMQKDLAAMINELRSTKHADEKRLEGFQHDFNTEINTQLKAWGAILPPKGLLQCKSMSDEIVTPIRDGMCNVSMDGAALLVLGSVCFGIFLFIVLVVVSKTWSLYRTFQPSEYQQVEDEVDPFLPSRQNGSGADGAITADFYGTHMMNPNTRQMNRMASNTASIHSRHSEPESQVGSTVNNNNSQGNNQQQPLWLRNSPPPAYESLQRHANEMRSRELSRQHY